MGQDPEAGDRHLLDRGASSPGYSQHTQESGLEMEPAAPVLFWVWPVLIYVAGLFVEVAGMFYATGTYVRQMDTISGQHWAIGAKPGVPHLVLYDLLGDALQDSRQSAAHGVFAVNIITNIFVVVWIVFIVLRQDIRLWTKTFIAAAVMAFVKGAAAWSTVTPDAGGWSGCQERLGEDGLMYFRLLSGAAEVKVGTVQSVIDIGLFVLQTFWRAGATGPQLCADTFISGSSYRCLLAAMCLYDSVRNSQKDETQWRQSPVLVLCGFAVFTVAALNCFMNVISGCHYTADVLLTICLTIFVYSNPAVVLLSNAMVGDLPSSDIQDPATWPMEQFTVVNPKVAPDLAEVSMPPALVPGGSSRFFLREMHGLKCEEVWTEERAEQFRLQVETAKRGKETSENRRLQLDQTLQQVERDCEQKIKEVQESTKRRIHEEIQKLQKIEDTALAQEQRKVEEERKASLSREEKVMAEIQRHSLVEADFEETRSKLMGEIEHKKRKGFFWRR